MSVYIGIFLQPLPQVGGGLCFLCIIIYGKIRFPSNLNKKTSEEFCAYLKIKILLYGTDSSK